MGWFLDAAQAIACHLSPIPSRFAVPSSSCQGSLCAVFVAARLIAILWALTLASLATLAVWRWLSVERHHTPSLIVPVAVCQFALFAMFTTVYKSQNPERLVSGIPFLVIASTVGLRSVWKTRLSTLRPPLKAALTWGAIGVAATLAALLIIGTSGIGRSRTSAEQLLDAIPDDAHLVMDEQIPLMVLYGHPGWSAVVQRAGNTSQEFGCLTIEQGKVAGYTLTCDCRYEHLQATVCESLAQHTELFVISAGADSPAASILTDCETDYRLEPLETLDNGWDVSRVTRLRGKP